MTLSRRDDDDGLSEEYRVLVASLQACFNSFSYGVKS